MYASFPTDKERAATLAKSAQEALDKPKDPCYGWDPLAKQQQAVKLDPENLQYRLNLMKLQGQHRGYVPSPTAIADVYREARDLQLDKSGELEMCFVESVLKYASKSSEGISGPVVDLMKKATLKARRARPAQDRVINFALAQLVENQDARDYGLAILRYELAYIADPDPKYLMAQGDLTAIGFEAWTDKPRLVFKKAEAALQAVRDLAYQFEMDLVRVSNFHAAEGSVIEGERLLKLGDVAGAEQKARRALELFPQYARPYVLLWDCYDQGIVSESQYLSDLEACQFHLSESLHPPWTVHRRARKGIALLKNGDYKDGMSLLDWALRDQPNNQTWLDAKRDAEAEKLGAEDAYLIPFAGVRDVQALRTGALKFWQKSEYAKSARVLALSIAQIPAWYSNEYNIEYSILHGERADCLYKLKQYSEAEKEYDTAYKICSKGGGATHLGDEIWLTHRLACLYHIQKPTSPLPQHLLWLKSHSRFHGFSGLEPPSSAWAALASEYFSFRTLDSYRRAEQLYEVAWKLESNPAKKTEWSSRRKEAWDEVQRICPDPVYVESEEHRRLRMQDIVSKRRERAKMDVSQCFNWYF